MSAINTFNGIASGNSSKRFWGQINVVYLSFQGMFSNFFEIPITLSTLYL